LKNQKKIGRMKRTKLSTSCFRMLETPSTPDVYLNKPQWGIHIVDKVIQTQTRHSGSCIEPNFTAFPTLIKHRRCRRVNFFQPFHLFLVLYVFPLPLINCRVQPFGTYFKGPLPLNKFTWESRVQKRARVVQATGDQMGLESSATACCSCSPSWVRSCESLTLIQTTWIRADTWHVNYMWKIDPPFFKKGRTSHSKEMDHQGWQAVVPTGFAIEGMC
jgi:hypothetical protein